MKISIITATLNSIQHINSVLDSIRQQTFKNIEHIVVDGGSTDGTIEYLKQSNQVTKFISGSDKGIYDALNKGIQMATGDIIGFLHSDDMLASPQSLQNIVDAFSFSSSLTPDCSLEEKQIDVLYGDLTYVNRKNPAKIIRYWKSKTFRIAFLQNGWMPAHPAVFMRRKIYDKHGLFDLSFKIAADYEFMLRVFSDQTLRFIYLPEVITKMRIGGMSNRNLKNIIQKSKEDYRAIRKNKLEYPLWVLFLKNFLKIHQFFIRHSGYRNKQLS
jgi:glycosyltransferase